MTDLGHEPLRQYILRPESYEKIYFPVMKMMVGRGYDPDDPIDIEKECRGPVCFTIAYENLGIKVDHKWVFRLRGAL